MENSISYSQAMDELEAIANEIENDDINIDQLTEKVNRASFLIKICQRALKTTDLEVREILKSLNNDNSDE